MWILAMLACVPLDGPLPAGTWGGEHWSLVVTPEGATLETDCAHGDLVDRVAVGGELEAAVGWVTEGGPVPEDPPDPVPAILRARATARHLWGTLSDDAGGWEAEVDVRLDEEPLLYKCL